MSDGVMTAYIRNDPKLAKAWDKLSIDRKRWVFKTANGDFTQLAWLIDFAAEKGV